MHIAHYLHSKFKSLYHVRHRDNTYTYIWLYCTICACNIASRRISHLKMIKCATRDILIGLHCQKVNNGSIISEYSFLFYLHFSFSKKKKTIYRNLADWSSLFRGKYYYECYVAGCACTTIDRLGCHCRMQSNGKRQQ